MAILKKLEELFKEAKVPYEVFNHPLAYTAQEIAAAQHVSGRELAKVVMLRVDGVLVMGVITGNQKIRLDALRVAIGATEVKLATEDEFTPHFPGCEIGAMPPFGNLFGLPVWVDPALKKDEYIYFNAGNHAQTIRLRYQDFEKMVQPRVIRLTDENEKNAA